MEEKMVEKYDEFGAFEGSAKTSADYFKAGVLYLVNVSKKPTEFEADSQFQPMLRYILT